LKRRAQIASLRLAQGSRILIIAIGIDAAQRLVADQLRAGYDAVFDRGGCMDQDPDIFLSSAFHDFMDIRAKIRTIDEKRIWAVDVHRKDLDQKLGASPFYIVDELMAQIRRSTLIICVLRDVYGTSVFGEAESVSFLETEIYQAALFHGNVRFFLMEPFNPPAKLRGLLELIRAIRPGVVPDRALPEDVVIGQIKRAVEATSPRKRSWTLAVRNLVGELERARGHPRPDIELFDRVFRPVSVKPDLDHIRSLLDGLDGEQSIEKRLTRTWIAIRELCAAPYDMPEFGEYLPHWDRALGVWSSSAAWYGLHGHLYAGRLAAVNSLLAIRSRLPGDVLHGSDERHFHGTKGARASEYYSMAKLMRSDEKRAEYYGLAERDIEDALRSGVDEPAGYLTIRGHIRLRQGNPDLALLEFEEVRRLHEGRDDDALAESLADLGLAQLELGNNRQAVSLLRESVERFGSAGNVTFCVRAKKRLALAYFRAWRPNSAARELREAYDMAYQHQIFDQIAPIMELLHRVSEATGLWRPPAR
jgi:tetratricopeptide (TPR) repeat protein